MRFLVLALIGLSLTGCNCNCGQTSPKDGGQGGSGGTTDGGKIDGGLGKDGGGGMGGGDAGDGTVTTVIPPGSFRLDGGSPDGGLGEQGSGVKLDPNGFIVLNSGSLEFHFMWIANNNQGWVSKYDTRTGKEVGRYWSVVPRDCYSAAGQPRGLPCPGARPNGLRGDHVNNPSRTAIDLNGDVWVANRANGIQGSVTKIANDATGCLDRNGNGTIETSRDLNNDGQILGAEMITPTDWDNPLQYDECVVFSTPLGTVGPDIAVRALAVSLGSIESSNGYVWAGIWRDKVFYKLDTSNGQPVAVNAAGAMTVPVNFGPYGAIVDGKQRLYVVSAGQALLALIDTATGAKLSDAISPPAGTTCGAYALGIDGKDRLWLPGFTTAAVACRYDHATGTWASFSFATATSQIGTAFGRPRGIAADDQGNIFMSSDVSATGAAAQLLRFDAETGALIKFGNTDFIDATDANTNQSIGVGLDADGQPWVNNMSGNVMKIDRVTGAITRTAQQPAGLYTYSDFTGYQLRKFTAPRGTYFKDFRGCGADAQWRQVVWDAVTPANTKVEVYVRVAATAAALPTATRFGPFVASPVDLVAAGVPKAEFFRVEFVLSSTDGMATPVLRSFRIVSACAGLIN